MELMARISACDEILRPATSMRITPEAESTSNDSLTPYKTEKQTTET
jgi:hypothetical protein